MCEDIIRIFLFYSDYCERENYVVNYMRCMFHTF